MATILLQAIQDLGPLYHEYEADRLIKEPWNAYSSLFYLIPAFYWFFKLKGQFIEYAILTIMLPFLFLNGIGSTIYHATRSSVVFTIMDGASAAIVIVITSIYLWKRLIGSIPVAVVIVLAFYFLGYALSSIFSSTLGDLALNLSYFISGSAFFIPAIILQFKRAFKDWEHLTAALLLMILALIFRSLDYPTPNPFPDLLPQGTHFLWHIFSALSAFPIGYFLYNLKSETIQPNKSNL